MGLPTPNLSTGEHNIHSPLEWVCLEEMEANVRVLIELVKIWAGKCVVLCCLFTREGCA
jgi:tripeptide aminopeptidase